MNAPGCTTTIGSYTDVPSLGCLANTVSNIINYALGILGAVTLLMLMWGAVKFVISSGDPKAIQSAQKTMTYAVIGAVFVLGSFILVNVVLTALGLPNALTNFSFYQ